MFILWVYLSWCCISVQRTFTLYPHAVYFSVWYLCFYSFQQFFHPRDQKSEATYSPFRCFCEKVWGDRGWTKIHKFSWDAACWRFHPPSQDNVSLWLHCPKLLAYQFFIMPWRGQSGGGGGEGQRNRVSDPVNPAQPDPDRSTNSLSESPLLSGLLIFVPLFL